MLKLLLIIFPVPLLISKTPETRAPRLGGNAQTAIWTVAEHKSLQTAAFLLHSSLKTHDIVLYALLPRTLHKSIVAFLLLCLQHPCTNGVHHASPRRLGVPRELGPLHEANLKLSSASLKFRRADLLRDRRDRIGLPSLVTARRSNFEDVLLVVGQAITLL